MRSAHRDHRSGGWDQDSLSTYLDEIGRYPLCTRDDEASLATRIRAGDEAALETLV